MESEVVDMFMYTITIYVCNLYMNNYLNWVFFNNKCKVSSSRDFDEKQMVTFFKETPWNEKGIPTSFHCYPHIAGKYVETHTLASHCCNYPIIYKNTILSCV